MTAKTVAQKGHVKPGSRIAVLNAPSGVVESLGFGPDMEFGGSATADLVLLFVNTRAELDALMPPAVQELAQDATIWVFFRKGARTAALDMDRNDVWAMADRHGLRPLGLLSVDATWSAFRLRPPKPA